MTATEQPYPLGPPAAFFSVQKSGTNALRKTLLLLGYEEVRSLSGRNLRQHVQARGITDDHLVWVDINAPQPVPYRGVAHYLHRVKLGHFTSGHVAYDARLEGELRRRGFRVISMCRDPRDVAVSLAKAIAAAKGGHHTWQQAFQHMSDDQQVRFAITGGRLPGDGPPLVPIAERFRRILGWDRCSHVLGVRFERLVGPAGGGKANIQSEELARIANHLGLKIDGDALLRIGAQVHGGTPTFRRGQIGSWRDAFTPELIEIAKIHLGGLVIDLGYERDDSWEADARGADLLA